MNQIILMGHVFFGVACLLATLWVFVDTLNASDANQKRIRTASLAAGGFMWLAFVLGGYFYVTAYAPDKAVILNGPKTWRFAHEFVMETKEHLVIILLLLATYLPVTTAANLAANKDARRLVLWVAGLTAALAFTMEGEGGIIAMGVKMGLLHAK
jgi:hypothetical protein